MSGHMFIALVNPKSGGQVGASLVARFREILDDDRVYDLAEDGGPQRALREHRNTDNLRIIGECLGRIFRYPKDTQQRLRH